MKPKDNFLEDLLIIKDNDKPEEKGKIFPLGYTDKRDVKKKKENTKNLVIQVNQEVVNLLKKKMKN